MDAHLKTLADASLAIARAEEALADHAHHTATEALDEAAALLSDLRAAWPAMKPVERVAVGRPAADVRARLDAARRRLPRLTALTVGTPVEDPDQETEPSD